MGFIRNTDNALDVMNYQQRSSFIHIWSKYNEYIMYY